MFFNGRSGASPLRVLAGGTRQKARRISSSLRSSSTYNFQNGMN
jgi:hypothetical protein